MTLKELQTLVEQIGTHVNTLAQSQNLINKLLREGIERTHEDVQALFIVTERHRERLENHGKRLNDLDDEGDEE